MEVQTKNLALCSFDPIEFSYRIEHRDDILWRNVREDVVNRIKDKAATGAEDLEPFQDMRSDRCWITIVEHRTGVCAAPPKRDVLAEISF